MRLNLNSSIIMKKSFLNKTYPWIGLVGSLCLIVPSLYNILDNPLHFTSEHIILGAGIVFMIVFLKELFDRIVNLKGTE